jgi:hypothetical protein
MDRGMDFELTMRHLFGDKAYQIAGTEVIPKHHSKWLQKTVRELLRLTNVLDTTPRHKRGLMASLEEVSKELRKADQPSWELIYDLLRLTFRLYGFGYGGTRCYSLAYWQTPEQRHTEELSDREGFTQAGAEDAVSLRGQVVEDLSSRGVDDFSIALVLNTSEYAVKQLRSNLRLKARTATMGRMNSES